jgi:uncharacterized protein (TIRG00374 family)
MNDSGTPWARALPTIRAVFALSVLALLAWRVDVVRVRMLLSQVSPGPLLAALGVGVTGTLFHAWRWRKLLRFRGSEPGRWEVVRVLITSNFVGLVLPGNLGGDLYRIHATRSEDVTLLQSTGLVVLDRYVGFLATFLMALPALVVGGFATQHPEIALIVLLLFLLFLLPVFLAVGRHAGELTENRLRQAGMGGFAELLHRAGMAVKAVATAPWLSLALLALSVAMKLCVAFVLVLLAEALGLRLRWLDVLVFLPLHSVVSSLPITPNGLGLREANLVVFFTELGLDAEQATSLAFLHLVWIYFTAIPGGLFLLAPRTDGRDAPRDGASRIG